MSGRVGGVLGGRGLPASGALVALGCLALSWFSGGATRAAATGPAPFPSTGLLVFSGGCTRCVGEPGLFTIRPDGKRQVGILITGFSGTDARWSPDRRWVAVGLSGEIRLVRADDSGFRLVTHPLDLVAQAEGDSEPSWFPDGKRLVFMRVSDVGGGASVTTSIWTVGADGHGAKRLLASPLPYAQNGAWVEPPQLYAPEISPNGRRLAFEQNEELWVAKADGTGRRRLGPPGMRGEEPRWSPDGRRIAYLDPDTDRLRILTLATNRIRTLPLDGVLQWAHAWSPDGRWLAVGADTTYACVDPTSNDVCDAEQLWIVNAFDGRMRKILPLESIHGIDWRR